LPPVASFALTIYIDRRMAKRTKAAAGKGQQILSGGGRKRVLVVLFIPSVERDGMSTIDQTLWVDLALEMLGRVFGGATAFPKARGVWRDDERDGTLVKDESQSSCTATQRPLTSRMFAILRRLATSAGSWAARLDRVKLASWWATSTSPSATLVKEQRDEDAAQHG
jgi:hypothetical protein